MKILYTLLIVFVSLSVNGQESYTIAGTVLDDEHVTLSFGEVLLREAADSTVVTFGSIEAGNFQLSSVAKGVYLVEVRALGFEIYRRAIDLEENRQLEIQLQRNIALLEGVTVKGKRNTVVNKNGNLKFTIDHSSFVNPGSTMDVLALLPGVQLSNDRQSISIIGKGDPLIYLENQRIYMEDLNALPIESIKSIEIINNPSARYESNGRVVVLVTRRLNFSDGIRLDISEVIALRRRFNSYATINAALKKKKWEWKANFSYNHIGIWENVNNQLNVPDLPAALDQSSVSTGPRPQFIIGGGFYYQIGKGEYLSANTNLRTHTTEAPINTQSTLLQGMQLDEITSFVDGFENRSFFSSNLNYNKQLPDGKGNLFLGLQYSSYLRDLSNQIFNNYNAQGSVFAQERYQKYTIDVFAARLDFERKLAQDHRWEAGLSYYHATADAFLDFDFLGAAPTLLSNYDYEERTYATYTQFTGQGHKWDYALGLRSETTTVEGGFREETELLVDRDQTLLFPKATLNWQLDTFQTLSFNYAKTVLRPDYLNASSISTFVHPFLEYTRNANLQATINEEFSLNYQYKTHSISVSYFNRQLPVYVTVEYDEGQDRLVQSPENLERENGFDIRLTSPFTYKFWSMTNFLMFTQVKVKDSRAQLGNSSPYLYYYSNHQFRLPKKWTAGLYAWGLSRQFQGIFERDPYWVLGGSLNKQFLKGLQVGIYFDDLFRAMKLREGYRINQIDARTLYLLDRRTFGLSLRYAFGRISDSGYQNRDVDEYLNRMK
ncbi:MAG: TonB-dependent receptor family protein [Saprospiraceae bacterium]|nr:TonB-dependent receptor family protein [Saprospiraceae bacterium]